MSTTKKPKIPRKPIKRDPPGPKPNIDHYKIVRPIFEKHCGIGTERLNIKELVEQGVEELIIEFGYCDECADDRRVESSTLHTTTDLVAYERANEVWLANKALYEKYLKDLKTWETLPEVQASLEAQRIAQIARLEKQLAALKKT